MRLLGYLLGACVVLAIVRVTMLALAIALTLATVVGVLTKPRETFGLLGLLLVCGAIESYGAALVVGIVALLALVLWADARSKSGED